MDNLNPGGPIWTCDSYDYSKQNTESLHKKNAKHAKPECCLHDSLFRSFIRNLSICSLFECD